MSGPFTVPTLALPLHRARWVLVASDLWRPALIASTSRGALGRAVRCKPGSTWRYEVFTVPHHVRPADEEWASWEKQIADPAVQVEAEHQDCFYRVNLELGLRLSRGTLKGFGREGSITGSWTAIPTTAWSILRAPHSEDYEAWRLGHLVGGGADLWDVHVLDTEGLPFADAASAYGPAEAAQIVQRAAAFGVATPPSSTLPGTRLHRRMASLTLSDQIGEDALRAARSALDTHLLVELEAGRLVGERRDAHGVRRPIPRAEWSRLSREIMRGRSSVSELADILVRPQEEDSPPKATRADTRPPQLKPLPATEAAFSAWVEQTGRAPTKTMAESWARENGHSIARVREMHSALGVRGRGRPKKA